jgi:predicted ATPase/Tfp pilus assembly protein PilF
MNIRTPDFRLRVFVSSTLKELAEERKAIRQAILKLLLAPVMFESGARPHPAQELYKSYLSQSQIFIGIYWQSYGWVAPNMHISGLEDEYIQSAKMPRLIYIKDPAPNREPALAGLLDRIRNDNHSCYAFFSTPAELKKMVQNDLVLLLTEQFDTINHEKKPPIKTMEHPPTNVPVQRNPLIGRECEMETARNLLLRDDIALITFTGSGGTGKTRLAIQIGLEMLDHFKDGVYLVRLEPLIDPDLVIPTIAETLGIHEAPGSRPIADILKEFLREKQMLLLLDNFEQVMEVAPFISELLETCPTLKIVVTSRIPLHLRAEKEYPVPALAGPPKGKFTNLDSLLQYAAIELFIQRAQAVKPDFAVTDANAPAVAGICYRLDGLPLAIELAAARSKLLTPQAILTRLQSSLTFLTSGAPDLPARHQTLRSTIAWSHALLDKEEQIIFGRLAIFSGGCTLEAAQAVCTDGRSVDIFSILESLFDKSLLHSETRAMELRFSMLETIREYALERLVETGELDELHSRHARYYLSFVQDAEPHLLNSDQLTWLEQLEAEHDNLRTALSWLLGNEKGELALQLAGALSQFWSMHSYLNEGRQWLEKGLAIAKKGHASASDQSKALYWAGFLAYRQTDLTSARNLFKDSLALARQSGEKKMAANALNGLGNAAWTHGDIAMALASYQESLALRRDIGDKSGISISLSNLGNVAWGQSDYTAARGYYEESLLLDRDAGDRQAIAWTLTHLGALCTTQADYARADLLLEESLALSRTMGDRSCLAETLNNLGLLARDKGLFIQAKAYCQESLDIYRHIGDKGGTADAIKNLGLAACGQGDYSSARSYFEESLAIGRQEGHKPAIAASLEGLGLVAFAQSDLAAARQLFLESLTIWWDMGYKPGVAASLERLAGTVCASGEAQLAAGWLAAAQALRSAIQAPLPVVDVAWRQKSYDSACQLLGSEVFSAVWAKGSALPLEQVIDEVIKQA